MEIVIPPLQTIRPLFNLQGRPAIPVVQVVQITPEVQVTLEVLVVPEVAVVAGPHQGAIKIFE